MTFCFRVIDFECQMGRENELKEWGRETEISFSLFFRFSATNCSPSPRAHNNFISFISSAERKIVFYGASWIKQVLEEEFSAGAKKKIGNLLVDEMTGLDHATHNSWTIDW